MTDRSIDDVVGELDEVLEAEREALLTGDLGAIGRMLDRKEKLVGELSRLDAEEATSLSPTADKLRRNQLLLEQAMDGIQSVATRLVTLRRVKETLDTYDSNGAKKSVKITQSGSVEKRA